MDKLQVQAAGLLSALGVSGVGPILLRDEISADLDATPFWLARRFGFLGTAAGPTFAAPGVAATLAVPGNESWYVIAVQLGIGPLAAGESVVSSIAIRTTNNNTLRIATNVGRAVVDAAGSNSWGFMLDQPLILLPGSALVAQIDDENVAAARPIDIAALGYKFTS